LASILARTLISYITGFSRETFDALTISLHTYSVAAAVIFAHLYVTSFSRESILAQTHSFVANTISITISWTAHNITYISTPSVITSAFFSFGYAFSFSAANNSVRIHRTNLSGTVYSLPTFNTFTISLFSASSMVAAFIRTYSKLAEFSSELVAFALASTVIAVSSVVAVIFALFVIASNSFPALFAHYSSIGENFPI